GGIVHVKTGVRGAARALRAAAAVGAAVARGSEVGDAEQLGGRAVHGHEVGVARRESILAAAEALGDDPRQVVLDDVVGGVVDIPVVGAHEDVVDGGALGDAARPFGVEVGLDAGSLA